MYIWLRKKITDFVMSEKFQDRRWPINEVDYIDDITKIFYEVCVELWLSVDFDQCDNWSECRIQSTVYVKNMIVDWTNNIWYNIILDCDVNTRFDEREELIETIYNQELHAQKIIQHFNS